ncbi:MAG: winged helix-turn-helix domain-containing protein [Dehalococcoidia bacterium]|jgi:uncharacterized protein|nr:winged helix-turn-helix domain-containing protein [Dehalococcoidia bacterium]
MPRTDLSADEARRIALAAQGFSEPRPSGRVDARHLRRVLKRINLLQLDSVNVVVRSHFMPFFSRLGPYPQELIYDLAFKRRELFEYWGHEASLLPVDTYPLLRHRMEQAVPRYQASTLMSERPEYAAAILEEVRANGPLTVSDLEDPGERTGPWWGHGPGKAALEWHFRTGAITTHDRRGFTRVYDATERVLPPHTLDAEIPTPEAAQRELLLRSARAHGVGTAKDLADYYRLKTPAARPLLNALVDEGALQRVTVEGWRQPAYLHPEAKLPRKIEARALLTPFDSLVWERDRTTRLFNFDYKIEIYVPEPQRRYGYYVMPFLLNGHLVARVDLKSERDTSTLVARATHIEPAADPREVASALATELRLMAEWLGLDQVRADVRGNLARELRVALG